jgi:hypothetical protein
MRPALQRTCPIAWIAAVASAIILVPRHQKFAGRSATVHGVECGSTSQGPSVFVPSSWAWSPQHRGYQDGSGCACRYSTIAAWSYASRHPTSLCSQRRRCHAGSAVRGATASAGLQLGAPRLRAGDGSEMSGCRLAILGRRLLQTIRQYWSEQGMVQLPDWSRLRGRAVAWDDPHTPEMGKSANATSRAAGN